MKTNLLQTKITEIIKLQQKYDTIKRSSKSNKVYYHIVLTILSRRINSIQKQIGIIILKEGR